MINTYFESDKITGKTFDRKLLKFIWVFLKKYKIHFFSTIIISLLSSALLISVPYVTALLIDEGVKRGVFSNIIKFGAMIFIIRINHFIFIGMQLFFMEMLGAKVVHDMRVYLFGHLQRLTVSYFDKNPVGRIVTRMTNDVTSVGDFFSEGVAMILLNFIFIIGAICFILIKNFQLGLIALAGFPFLCYFSYKIAVNIRALNRVVREKLAIINAFLSEHISGMKIVNIFTQEEKVIKKFDDANRSYMFNMIDQMRFYALLIPLVTFFTGLSVALIILFGGKQVFSNNLTVGYFVAYISYINWIMRPVREVIEKYNIFIQSSTALERLYKLSLIKDENEEYENEVLQNVQGFIEFKNINFYYEPDKQVLKNISFKIYPGERIAIVGATGSGKTTILNLLNKFYQPTSGEIYIDNKNIRTITRNSLRKHVGKIDQNVHIFTGTIRENIVLGHEISDENFQIALETSNCDKIIKKINDGVNYRITEGGKNLSFGQRQLISFARIVAYNPSILILDEATSNIDTDNEKYIIGAIEKITRGRTSIVVAHRLSTIINSDRIYVVDNGEIIEVGTHEDLLIKKGKYATLYQNMERLLGSQ